MGPAPPFVQAVLRATKPKLFTLAIVHDQQNKRVLLGRKKKGFGEGYFNGFGGKVEGGETIAQAAHRELHEEAGITVPDLHHRGVLTFVWDDRPVPWEVHVFCATDLSGVPVETQEMAPVWTPIDQIPYDRMWADDVHWYPLFLQGASFQGVFAFTDTHTLVWHRLKEVQDTAEIEAPQRSLLRSCSQPHHFRIVQEAMVQTRRQSARAAKVESHQQTNDGRPVQELFEGIRNIRDLAEQHASIAPGRVFRTAAPLKATAEDVRRLYNDLAIKDLVDLRSSEELVYDGSSPAFTGSSFCSYRRDPAVSRVVPDASSYKHGDSDVVHVQIPIMEKQRYYISLLRRMSKRLALKLMLLRLVDEPASRKLAIAEVNRGGLEGLYRILLEDSGPWFAAALRHISKSAEAGRPVLFFCKAGKDRTGLVAAMILTLMGASEEAILEDYIISDQYHQVGLAGLEDNPKTTGLDRDAFERAPRQAMHYALRLLEDAGGVQQYLVNAGFDLDEQEQLRQVLAQSGSGLDS